MSLHTNEGSQQHGWVLQCACKSTKVLCDSVEAHI